MIGAVVPKVLLMVVGPRDFALYRNCITFRMTRRVAVGVDAVVRPHHTALRHLMHTTPVPRSVPKECACYDEKSTHEERPRPFASSTEKKVKQESAAREKGHRK